jgi:uncharacterized membrane protein YczE
MDVTGPTPTRPGNGRVPSGMATLLVGLVLVAVGVGFSIRAELGVAPFDVLTTGLASSVDLEIGVAAMIVPLVFVALAVAIGGRPGPGTVVAVLLVGPILGLVLRVLPDLDALAPRLGLFVIGFFVLSAGITAVVVADVGPGPAELLMLAVHDRGVAISPARTGIEVVSVAVGWVLGGQVGVGTVLVALLIGPVLQRFLTWVGFERAKAAEVSECASPGA